MSSIHEYLAPGGHLFARCWRSVQSERAPVVLIHDSLGCTELWRDFPPALAAATSRTVISYDRLGFGKSTARQGRPGTDFIHEEAEVYVPALLHGLGVSDFVVFGHSVGGAMALALAALCAGRCEAVITEAAQAFVEPRTLAGIEAVNLDLGGGVDWLIYNASAAVIVDLSANAATGFASVSNVEKVIGGSGDDTLTGDGLDNRLDGLSGNDNLNGGAGADAVLGGDGDDIIFASAGNDSLQGLAGNDTFHGGDGDDALEGGAGDDIATGGPGNDDLYGGTGNDTFHGGDGDDVDEIVPAAVVVYHREELRLPNPIDLVEGQDRRHPGLSHSFEHELVPPAEGLGCIDQQEHEIHVLQALDRELHHAPVHFVLRLVDPRSVEEHDLRRVAVGDGQDPVPRGLRFGGDDGDLLPHEAVEEGGLPHVRASDDGDESRAQGPTPLFRAREDGNEPC